MFNVGVKAKLDVIFLLLVSMFIGYLSVVPHLWKFSSAAFRHPLFAPLLNYVKIKYTIIRNHNDLFRTSSVCQVPSVK